MKSGERNFPNMGYFFIKAKIEKKEPSEVRLVQHFADATRIVAENEESSGCFVAKYNEWSNNCREAVLAIDDAERDISSSFSMFWLLKMWLTCFVSVCLACGFSDKDVSLLAWGFAMCFMPLVLNRLLSRAIKALCTMDSMSRQVVLLSEALSHILRNFDTKLQRTCKIFHVQEPASCSNLNVFCGDCKLKSPKGITSKYQLLILAFNHCNSATGLLLALNIYIAKHMNNLYFTFEMLAVMFFFTVLLSLVERLLYTSRRLVKSKFDPSILKYQTAIFLQWFNHSCTIRTAIEAMDCSNFELLKPFLNDSSEHFYIFKPSLALIVFLVAIKDKMQCIISSDYSELLLLNLISSRCRWKENAQPNKNSSEILGLKKYIFVKDGKGNFKLANGMTSGVIFSPGPSETNHNKDIIENAQNVQICFNGNLHENSTCGVVSPLNNNVAAMSDEDAQLPKHFSEDIESHQTYNSDIPQTLTEEISLPHIEKTNTKRKEQPHIHRRLNHFSNETHCVKLPQKTEFPHDRSPDRNNTLIKPIKGISLVSETSRRNAKNHSFTEDSCGSEHSNQLLRYRAGRFEKSTQTIQLNGIDANRTYLHDELAPNPKKLVNHEDQKPANPTGENLECTLDKRKKRQREVLTGGNLSYSFIKSKKENARNKALVNEKDSRGTEQNTCCYPKIENLETKNNSPNPSRRRSNAANKRNHTLSSESEFFSNEVEVSNPSPVFNPKQDLLPLLAKIEEIRELKNSHQKYITSSSKEMSATFIKANTFDSINKQMRHDSAEMADIAEGEPVHNEALLQTPENVPKRLVNRRCLTTAVACKGPHTKYPKRKINHLLMKRRGISITKYNSDLSHLASDEDFSASNVDLPNSSVKSLSMHEDIHDSPHHLNDSSSKGLIKTSDLSKVDAATGSRESSYCPLLTSDSTSLGDQPLRASTEAPRGIRQYRNQAAIGQFPENDTAEGKSVIFQRKFRKRKNAAAKRPSAVFTSSGMDNGSDSASVLPLDTSEDENFRFRPVSEDDDRTSEDDDADHFRSETFLPAPDFPRPIQWRDDLMDNGCNRPVSYHPDNPGSYPFYPHGGHPDIHLERDNFVDHSSSNNPVNSSFYPQSLSNYPNGGYRFEHHQEEDPAMSGSLRYRLAYDNLRLDFVDGSENVSVRFFCESGDEGDEIPVDHASNRCGTTVEDQHVVVVKDIIMSACDDCVNVVPEDMSSSRPFELNDSRLKMSIVPLNVPDVQRNCNDGIRRNFFTERRLENESPEELFVSGNDHMQNGSQQKTCVMQNGNFVDSCVTNRRHTVVPTKSKQTLDFGYGEKKSDFAEIFKSDYKDVIWDSSSPNGIGMNSKRTVLDNSEQNFFFKSSYETCQIKTANHADNEPIISPIIIMSDDGMSRPSEDCEKKSAFDQMPIATSYHTCKSIRNENTFSVPNAHCPDETLPKELLNCSCESTPGESPVWSGSPQGTQPLQFQDVKQSDSCDNYCNGASNSSACTVGEEERDTRCISTYSGAPEDREDIAPHVEFDDASSANETDAYQSLQDKESLLDAAFLKRHSAQSEAHKAKIQDPEATNDAQNQVPPTSQADEDVDWESSGKSLHLNVGDFNFHFEPKTRSGAVRLEFRKRPGVKHLIFKSSRKRLSVKIGQSYSGQQPFTYEEEEYEHREPQY